MTTASNKPAAWFWIIAVIGLLWNLGGVYSFILHITMSEETVQTMSDDERSLYTNFPGWVLVTYCVAVFGSTIGSVLLLMRKSVATPVLITSFVAIVLQMIYTIFLSKAVEVHGPQALGVPSLVIIYGALLVWTSMKASAKGWLD